MKRRTWTTTGMALMAAAGLGLFAGCEQEANETYQYPETPADAPGTPGAGETGTGMDRDAGTDTETGGNVGEVGPMGTTRPGDATGGQGEAGPGTGAGGGGAGQ